MWIKRCTTCTSFIRFRMNSFDETALWSHTHDGEPDSIQGNLRKCVETIKESVSPGMKRARQISVGDGTTRMKKRGGSRGETCWKIGNTKPWDLASFVASFTCVVVALSHPRVTGACERVPFFPRCRRLRQAAGTAATRPINCPL